MPRPQREGGSEPKRRSRHGCWPCKSKKIKCGEEKPNCDNCQRAATACDYSIRLNWDGRRKKKDEEEELYSSLTLDSVFSADAHSPSHLSIRPLPWVADGSPFLRPAKVRPHSSQSQSFSVPSPDSQSVHGGVSSAAHIEAFPSEHGYQGQPLSRTETSLLPSPQAHRPPASPGQLAHAWNHSNQSLEHHHKKRRTSPHVDSPNGSLGDTAVIQNQLPASGMSPRVSQRFLTPYSLTPTGSATSDDSQTRNPSQAPSTPQSSHDVRKLSIKSLLHSPSDDQGTRHSLSILRSNEAGIYGYDQGRPDLDIPRNDDANALNILSPESKRKQVNQQEYFSKEDLLRTGFGFGLQAVDRRFEGGDYYSSPVPVKIPRCLDPLPQTLLENPMKLLYFHHFLNHTARILVPHDCPENPFRNILPKMAIGHSTLLNLMLAYSATHRARLLNHPDPCNRIALLVRNVFPSLRRSLNESHETQEKTSNVNLATAVMLASLDIISPNAFEVHISWQQHLTIARQIIISRGGYEALPRNDRASFFLSRWFCYLDVVGSLSGGNYDRPLPLGYKSDEGGDAEDPWEVDCLLGFTSRCVAILSKIANLAKECDIQRIGLGGQIRDDWQPSEEVVEVAGKLKHELQAARPTAFKGCPHRESDADVTESLEISAVNDTFHWAGLIHLYRRILGKRSDDEGVQIAVREIISALDRIRTSGTAEANMVFPLFTAGCEALEEAQRIKILNRILLVEPYGMTQVHRARLLMQKVWATGKPWQTLVSGEFFG